MSHDVIQVLYAQPMQLGECPLWHTEEGALYWIDIVGQEVHRHVLRGDRHHVWHLPSEPGCIALCEGGGLIVAMRSGIAHLDTDTGTLQPIVDAPYDPSLIRFNDGRCDAAGRLWVGTLYEPRDHAGASLYCLDRGFLRDVPKPATVSNGVAFSPDSRTLYHTDTTAHRITAYDYDLATAQVGNGRLLRQFSTDKSGAYGGRPDGAAIDSEGAYWCAMYEGGRILRLSPGGDVLREISLPVLCPTMIAFGGTDLGTLFITSVRHRRTPTELSLHPLSGCVLSLQVDIPGRIETPYKQ
jgi:sugar lactone lactonase YvrE